MEATREIEEIQSEGDTDVSLPPDSEEKTEEEPSTSRQKPTPVNAGWVRINAKKKRQEGKNKGEKRAKKI